MMQQWKYDGLTLFGPHHVFICRYCGHEYPFLHGGQPLTERWEDLLDRQVCFTCDHFLRLPEEGAIIVGGTHYLAGDEESRGLFRGFGGRRFTIRRLDGGELVSTNLWCQGDIPEALRQQFPRFADNAIFLEVS